jgi:hypothetical protein
MTARRAWAHWLWLALAVMAIPVVVRAAPDPNKCSSCYTGQCQPYTYCGQCPARFVYTGRYRSVLCSCCDTTSLACGAYYWWYGPANTNYSGTAYYNELRETGPPPSSCVAGRICYSCWDYIYNNGSVGGCC